MNKHIFLLRWILLAFCYWFSIPVSAANAVDLAQAGATPDKSIANVNVQTAKKKVAISDNTSKAIAPVFVFVDTLLDNYQTLVKDIQDHSLKQNVTIVYLDPDHNGVQQITDTLAHQTDVAAIHLLTHGMAGSIQLGSVAVNQNTIDLYTSQLTSWRKSLSANADILIYGCNVTSTDAGLQLIQHIGDLTQAHVAASKNVTGNISFGGDWNLESHYGKIQTNVIISAQTQQTWDAILAYSTYISIGPGGVDQTFTASSNVGTSFSYDSPGATYSVNRVVVQLKILAGADTSQNITLCLRSSWNGANLSSATLPTSALTTSFAWYGFNVGATTLNDNQVYYIQIYTLSTDAKTVANTWNSSQWNSNTELMVGVTAYPSKELTFMLATGTNTTPTVSNAIPDQTGTPNVAFAYTVASNAFADADTGDRLTYSATLSSNAALPAWLSFNTSTRAFSGTPTTAGTISVKVTASDGTASVSDIFDIVVNTPPVVNSAIPDQTATEGIAFSFTMSATAFTDADGNALTYSATLSSNAALPAWLSFNATTRVFSGTPASGDVGTISVKVTASDSIASVNDTFDIVISPTSLHHYGITLTSPGVVCAASQITITAYNSVGGVIAPPNGTVITLTTSPATGTWVGGNTATFDGVVTSKAKFLQQTTATTLNINVTDGVHSESVSLDPSITFDAATLAFYGSTGLGAMPNQVAGTADANPILKVANCAAQANATANQSVQFGYECRNPTTCAASQTLTVRGTNIQSNANGATISYSAAQSVPFNGSGIASIPINYSDVGQVKIYASVTIAANGNNPAVTLTANSGDFIVRPYTLVTSAVTTTGGVANPVGTDDASKRFVAAGTPFKVFVEARNSGGTKTPNFGNETSSENNIKFVAQTLSYPSGGALPAVSGATSFTRTAIPSTGEFVASTVVWDQVGSFIGQAELADNNYLGAGDLVTKTASAIIGRFYPDYFALVGASTTTNSCGTFSYLSHPAIGLNYTLEARSVNNTVLTNYGGNYAYTAPSGPTVRATPTYVAENDDSGNGATFASRVSGGTAPNWVNGVATLASTTASVARGPTIYTLEAPYTSLRLGLDIVDTFDGRSLTGKDMNATTVGLCGGGCTAVALGSPLTTRYGRLRLDNTSGPEMANLPVNLYTEYWTGSSFILNTSDSCTVLPPAAITYTPVSPVAGPGVTVATSSSLNVAPSIPTTGIYGAHFIGGKGGHYFTAPGVGGVGTFTESINLTTVPWLLYDWNQNSDFTDDIVKATLSFGTYRGNDRIIYWHEKL